MKLQIIKSFETTENIFIFSTNLLTWTITRISSITQISIITWHLQIAGSYWKRHCVHWSNKKKHVFLYIFINKSRSQLYERACKNHPFFNLKLPHVSILLLRSRDNGRHEKWRARKIIRVRTLSAKNRDSIRRASRRRTKAPRSLNRERPEIDCPRPAGTEIAYRAASISNCIAHALTGCYSTLTQSLWLPFAFAAWLGAYTPEPIYIRPHAYLYSATIFIPSARGAQTRTEE